MSNSRTLLLLFLAVFAAGVALFSRANAFPFFYHPDEPRKVAQLTQNKRNMHHPLLMLTTADIARRVVLWGDARKDPQKVVVVGRWLTAAAAALIAASLAVLAAQLHGTFAGIAVGLVTAVTPLLFELGHYFKEDPYLVAGIAMTCLAVQRFRSKPDSRGLALLGAATALAAAGKYVGFAMLPIAVTIALTTNSELSLKQRMKWLLGGFAVVWLAFNWWIFKSPELIWRSIGEETTKAFGGEEGFTRSVPHAYYWDVQNTYSSVWIWVGFGAWLVCLALRKVRLSLAEGILLGAALLFALVFSFTPKTSPRYHLPIGVALAYFAAVGAYVFPRILFANQKVIATAIGLVAAFALATAEAQMLVPRYRAFAQDDRAALIAHVKEQLPSSAVIAQDEAVNLPEPARRKEHAALEPLPQTIIGKKQIADRGDLAALRKEGVTHVAICNRRSASTNPC
jgi:hypothetical protein